MGILSEILVPRLKVAFPGEILAFQDGDTPFLIIEPRWPEFGRIRLHDDDDEVTIEFGNFTHIHCSNFDGTLHARAKAEAIADDVVRWLADTFGDRVRFWSNGFGGGCVGCEHKAVLLERGRNMRIGIWSKPVP